HVEMHRSAQIVPDCAAQHPEHLQQNRSHFADIQQQVINHNLNFETRRELAQWLLTSVSAQLQSPEAVPLDRNENPDDEYIIRIREAQPKTNLKHQQFKRAVVPEHSSDVLRDVCYVLVMAHEEKLRLQKSMHSVNTEIDACSSRHASGLSVLQSVRETAQKSFEFLSSSASALGMSSSHTNPFSGVGSEESRKNTYISLQVAPMEQQVATVAKRLETLQADRKVLKDQLNEIEVALSQIGHGLE
ncbi:hypothetical protein HDU93_004219, partial [Gonapodya sp. JEL0774]